MAGPIDVSNVQIVCPSCNKATRVAHKEEGDNKLRVCKKCGASLEPKKAEKKAKKSKTDKSEAAPAEEVKEKKSAKKPAAKKTTAKKPAKEEVETTEPTADGGEN